MTDELIDFPFLNMNEYEIDCWREDEHLWELLLKLSGTHEGRNQHNSDKDDDI